MRTLLFILLLLFLTTACLPLTDYENTQEEASQALLYLDESHQAQQSLHLRRVPPKTLTLWIAHPAQDALPATSLTLTLEGTGQRGPWRVSRTYGLPRTPQQTPYPFALPPAEYLPNQPISLTLQVHGGGLWLYGSAEETYPPGSLRLDGTAQPGDLAFRLTYDYGLAALGQDARHLLTRLWLLLPLGLLLLLPGALLHRGQQPIPGLLIFASAAFWPLLLAWTSLTGLSWSRPLALTFGLGLAALLASLRPTLRPPSAHSLQLILLTAFALAVRLIMLRDLALSPWVDSVHHALITRLIVEQGAYPATYFPYSLTANAHYHSGFHALVAFFHWYSGLPIPQAMLILGQVLNALLSSLGVYTFSRALRLSHRAALLAALIASLFTPMPAYYLSWGRYTQLAGLLLLPPAFALWTAYGRTSSADKPHALSRSAFVLHFALLLGALLITHYRVFAFLVLLLAAWELVHLGKGSLPALIPRLSAALLGGVLALPWLWPAIQGFITPKAVAWSSGPSQPLNDFAWRYLSAGLGRYTLALAALGLLWALWQQRRSAWTLILWVSGMFLLANLGALRLPGRALVNNTSVEISLFLPIAALGGLCLDALLQAWDSALLSPSAQQRWGERAGSVRIAYHASLALLLAVTTFHGLRATLNILNPVTILFHEQDRAAMQWIDANLPRDALVLINPAPWGYGLYVGADGGYWISPTTGRRTLPPTLLYGWGARQEIQQVNAQSSRLLEIAADPPALADFMRRNGAAYLYIGARGGPFSARSLQESALFTPLYHRGDTWVFTLRP